jgi:hypothetical protein
LDPVLVCIAEEADGAEGRSGDELDGEDAVDLADKLVANIDGGFSDRASKLRMRTSDVSKRNSASFFYAAEMRKLFKQDK